MSKPLGLTQDFRVVVPSRVQDQIHEAVQEAVAAGVSIQDFLKDVRDSWIICMDDQKKYAIETLDRVIKLQ